MQYNNNYLVLDFYAFDFVDQWILRGYGCGMSCKDHWDKDTLSDKNAENVYHFEEFDAYDYDYDYLHHLKVEQMQHLDFVDYVCMLHIDYYYVAFLI
jgi:hypothetical protein